MYILRWGKFLYSGNGSNLEMTTAHWVGTPLDPAGVEWGMYLGGGCKVLQALDRHLPLGTKNVECVKLCSLSSSSSPTPYVTHPTQYWSVPTAPLLGHSPLTAYLTPSAGLELCPPPPWLV